MKVIFLLLLLAHQMPDSADASESHRKAELSLGQIRDLLGRSRMKLLNVKVFSKSHHVGNQTQLVWKVSAAKKRSRYERLWHGTRDGCLNDPRAYLRFYDGTHFNIFMFHDRRYDVCQRLAVIPYINKIRTNSVFEALGWWPPDDDSQPLRPWGEPFFIHEIITDERCELATDQKLVDGHWCHVLRIPNILTCWVDTRLGVIRKREHYRVNSDGKPELAMAFDLSDFREVEKGLWLPFRFQRRLPILDYHTMHQIISWQVNNVRDELFRFQPPPGTFIYDRDYDTSHQIPGGLGLLDEISRRLQQDLPKARISQPLLKNRKVPVQAMMFGLGFLMVWILRRRLS